MANAFDVGRFDRLPPRKTNVFELGRDLGGRLALVAVGHCLGALREQAKVVLAVRLSNTRGFRRHLAQLLVSILPQQLVYTMRCACTVAGLIKDRMMLAL